MKIAIPVADGRLSMHFGHCEAFALFEIEEKSKKVTSSKIHSAPPHQPGLLPRWLHELGANVILAGGMGQRAITLFQENGIRVVTGVPGGVPEDIVAAYLNETLQSGENVCDH